MAAYGALVSVMNIIDQIQTHPKPPISIDHQQVESLTQVVTSLQEFLEGYSPHSGYTEEEDIWESRIAEAAYAAEDVIESYIVDQILACSRNDVQNITSIQFYQGVQKVIESMNSIKIEIKEKMVLENQLHIKESVSTAAAAGSSRSTSTSKNVTMIGFDDVLLQMLDKITRGGLNLQILPIVGMGGIGKTTLARNIFVSPLIQHHLDVCAWSTISQKYNAHKILRQILDEVDKKENRMRDLSEDELGKNLYKYMSVDELGLRLYQYLIGNRYFIVMDDMWNIEAWDGVRRFFPDNRNGSRIVVTTRLSNLASHFNYSNGLDMKFLDEDASWNLFSKTVFGEESCPIELEDIGKRIVESCEGLPLLVAVIGGLLSKSERTKENWVYVEKNLSSVVNLDDNESCLQVLYLSYNNLPVHLKPCFLCLGLYDEFDIPIFTIQILVFEGFVKPANGKSLEEVAEEYMDELVDRNLLIVEKGNRSFKMHDLLKDLCLREARKLKFSCVLKEHSIPQGINSARRIESSLSEYPTPLLQALGSASLLRVFSGEFPNSLSYNFRLLRTVKVEKYPEAEDNPDYYEEIIRGLVNLRLLIIHVNEFPLPSSVYLLWNLQTIMLFSEDVKDYACEIWKMPLLRLVIIYGGTLDGAYCLPDPLSDKEDMGVLENLHTLFEVRNLKFGDGVLKRIPNIKTLKIRYNRKVDTSGKDSSEEDSLGEGEEDATGEEDEYLLNNICCLQKLETLRFRGSSQLAHIIRQLSFPHSLKKLSLKNTYLPWEYMKTEIGSLPLLQVLKLKNRSFCGSEWETCEDQFLNLKILAIEKCDPESWITDKTHFPRLEHLHLCLAYELEEIPLSIGDIPTLQSITMKYCSDSVVKSAERIKEEQEELSNENLQIHVISLKEKI